jgi:DNA-binding CsgD family transcriptional regulator
LKQQISNKEVADIAGLSQSKTNWIRKIIFENIVMPGRGRSQVLLFEKRSI